MDSASHKHKHSHHPHNRKHKHSRSREKENNSKRSNSQYEESEDMYGVYRDAQLQFNSSTETSTDHNTEPSLDIESMYKDSLYSHQNGGLEDTVGNQGRGNHRWLSGEVEKVSRFTSTPGTQEHTEIRSRHDTRFSRQDGDSSREIRSRESVRSSKDREARGSSSSRQTWDRQEGMNTDHSMRASGRNFQDNRKRLEDRGYDNHRRSEDRTHDNHSRSEERIHNNHRRSKDRMQESMRRPEDRIRQDAVSRGAESGQIRSPTLDERYLTRDRPRGLEIVRPSSGLTIGRPLSGLTGGRPGSGLAEAAALVGLAAPKIPPPIPQKPEVIRNGRIEDCWPNSFRKYAASEVCQDQDSLDGHSVLPSPLDRKPPPHRPPKPAVDPPKLATPSPRKLSEVDTKSGDWDRSQEFSEPEPESDGESSSLPSPPSQSSKPTVKPSMERPDRAQSNYSHKTAISKNSKTSRVTSSRPQGKTEVSKMPSISLNPFSGVLWDRREPFKQLWITLSAMYGKFLVLLMIAFCLIEVMDNNIKPLTFQAYFMMYLYIGSIIAIMCIYITVLLDNCPSVSSSRLVILKDTLLKSWLGLWVGILSQGWGPKFYIFYIFYCICIIKYLLILVFGLGTLIFNGLEIAMHATMNNKNCVDDVVLAHPILQALFTFLQMHFLFVNSTVIVEKFGLLARFGFIHLVATNLSLWVRTIIWESASEWVHHVYTKNLAPAPSDVIRVPDRSIEMTSSDDDFAFHDRIDIGNYDYTDRSTAFSLIQANRGNLHCNNSFLMSPKHISQKIRVLGKFIVEYSLIAAAVTYIMWRSVGQDKMSKTEGKKMEDEDTAKKRKYWRVDCQSASKVLIIFFVMKDNPEYRGQMFWIYSGAEIVIFGLSIFASFIGFIQIQKLSHTFSAPYDLDTLLSTVTITGSYIFAIFSALAAVMSLGETKSIIIFTQNIMLIVQITLQGMIMSEAGRRVCMTRSQQTAKPGRQIITFLLFANITLWILDTFISNKQITQGIQTEFYGLLAWGIISRISLPLLIFYRFHSCVVLVEIWKNTYRTKDIL
ncbi:uncharacterized protein LOC111695966 [Eurytemora carolleeae]|uniref:uncharacterized protein LOC111695966 n=1 Tax=Eurytemora carolleeae TaxID=1294199 RepID=UPI000C7939D2|nr:uncharacterized protein LOC111695966 [Eurytemora carolleeae]|eukprot:XP_023321227.1 uncharacterized protein LOC111695966 [Eurytemora affinis]